MTAKYRPSNELAALALQKILHPETLTLADKKRMRELEDFEWEAQQEYAAERAFKEQEREEDWNRDYE